VIDPSLSTIDNLVFPHLDLHVALNGGLTLTLDVVHRSLDPQMRGRLRLDSVLDISTFKFFAPHNEPGKRFDGIPTCDPTTGVVTATAPGVYLFQVAIVDKVHPAIGMVGSVVGRLQVHKELVDWWFGIDSITTALDPDIPLDPQLQFGHAQPSIYARFEDDPGTGTDPVGDITGHGYVKLTTDDPSKVAVRKWDRLQGLDEGPATIKGSLPGGQAKPLAVQVVFYGKIRLELRSHFLRKGVEPVGEKFNVVFLAEGFSDTKADRDLFEQIVQRATTDMFEKPRHEPFHMLAESFNVFSVFTPSRQRNVTLGNRISDTRGQGHFSLKGLPGSRHSRGLRRVCARTRR
jgi:hypothetical protein